MKCVESCVPASAGLGLAKCNTRRVSGVRASVLCGLLAVAACAPRVSAAAPAPDAPSNTPTPHETRLHPIEVTGNREATSYAPGVTNTATGTETPVLDTPFSIAVIPATVLADQGAQSLADALRNAPGVYEQQGEGNRDEFYLRGVKTKSDFFVNGLRDDSEYFRPLYNIAHVDVLQGPAALLFGRGTAGGAINLVTKKPERRAIRNFTFRTGSFNRLQGTADVGGALGQHGAYRVMAMGEHSQGYRDHYFVHRYAINPELRYNFGENTQLDVSLSWLRDRREGDRGIPSRNGRPAPVDRDTFFGAPDQNRTLSRVAAGDVRLKHRFSDHLHVRNAFRVSRTKHRYVNAYPGSAVDASGLFEYKAYDHPSSQLSYLERAELVADFDTGVFKHTVLGGVEYGWQYGDDVEYLPGASKTLKDSSGHALKFPVANPQIGPVNFPFLDRQNHFSSQELGLFVQDQIALGEHWKALVGVRWDRYRVQGEYYKSGQQSDNTHYHWSPRAGLVYKPVTNDSIYVSFSQSFTPQGARILSLHGPGDANVAPRTAVNYELGNKLELFHGDLALTAAIFQLELKNQIANAPDGSGRLVNTGRQRNRGFEVSARGALTDKWSVFANYTYLDARITAATTDARPGDLVGLVPFNQFSIWTRYSLTQHWGFGVGVRGADRRYTSFDNVVKLPGYMVGSAMGYYQGERYRVQLNLDNLADRLYYSTANGDNQIMPGPPLAVTLSLGARF